MSAIAKTLQFMGIGPEEEFRCRVYGGEDETELERRAFVEALATTGVLDCPAYDGWIRALQEKGWVPWKPEFEGAKDGGCYARWRLTPLGLEEWAKERKNT